MLIPGALLKVLNDKNSILTAYKLSVYSSFQPPSCFALKHLDEMVAFVFIYLPIIIAV